MKNRNSKGQFIKGHKHTKEALEKNRIWHIGNRRSEETKEKISKNNVRYWLNKPGNQQKKNHWNWKGGISTNLYPRVFNRELKFRVRQRDNFTCQLCGKKEKEELKELNRVLCVNHIDFNKDNCKEKNLNTLCNRCNIKVNRNREYWTKYFQKREPIGICL